MISFVIYKALVTAYAKLNAMKHNPTIFVESKQLFL